jgi:Mce-associated membrane protein
MPDDPEIPETADPPEKLGESGEAQVETETEAVSEPDVEAEVEIESAKASHTADRFARLRLSRVGWALVAGVVVVATLTGLGGWFGYRVYEKRDAQDQRSLFIQTARQGAVNLTTISYTEVESDVQRILDSATGTFRDDFDKRSQPFIEVVKAAQSRSDGTVTEAGLESQRGDSAQVLVAVSVKSQTAAGEQAPREWRMRIEVQAVGDGAKVSNVVFVP